MTRANIGRVLIVLSIMMILIPALALTACCMSPSCRSESDENAESYIFLEATVTTQEIAPSESINYEIIVRNLGDENITYYSPTPSSFALPSGWAISFSPETSLFIVADGYEVLTVTLSSPADAEANDIIELEIIGSTSNPNTQIIEADLTARVKQIFDISFHTASRVVLDSPLDTKTFGITVENNGNSDEHVELKITGIPSGLELSQESQEFIINNGETDSLTITMSPSSLLIVGEYKLNMSLYRINPAGMIWVSSQILWVEVRYSPDLYIDWEDIELSKYVPYRGEDVFINITVHNIGDSDARNFTISIFPITRWGSQLEHFDDVTIEFLGINSSTTIQLPWRAEPPAVNKIQVILDFEGTVQEKNEKNNNAELPVTIIYNPLPGNYTPEEDEYSISLISAVGIGILAGILIATCGFILTTEWGKFGLYRIISPFYTRVKKEDVLNHEVRELVYDYVQNHPGEHFRAILTKLHLTNGTLVHHLNTLERQEFIKSDRDGSFKRYYPTGRQFTEDVLEINGIQKKILDAVGTTPGITQKDLSIQLNTSPPTINYHVKALRGVRLINIKRDGKNTRCFPGHGMNGFYRGGVS